MNSLKMYRCNVCGNMIYMVDDQNVTPVCCGEEMQTVKENTEDGKSEKHVPVVTHDGCTVTVKIGESEHPMTEEHYIRWILLMTDKGMYIRTLKPGEKPEAVFRLSEKEQTEKCYAYCNIHGLWSK